jgi:hypothetical protein
MPADNRRAVYEAQSPEMICEVVERIDLRTTGIENGC